MPRNDRAQEALLAVENARRNAKRSDGKRPCGLFLRFCLGIFATLMRMHPLQSIPRSLNWPLLTWNQLRKLPSWKLNMDELAPNFLGIVHTQVELIDHSSQVLKNHSSHMSHAATCDFCWRCVGLAWVATGRTSMATSWLELCGLQVLGMSRAKAKQTKS